ncbi:DMT family transporter [Dialister sp.]|uniref:DMT family transporter n=1 Tax=Dialister sp. TaxID=1955814 RepID=UPI003F0C47A8
MKEEAAQAKLQFILAMMIFGTLGIFIRHIPLPSTVIAEVRGITGTLFLLAVVFLRHSSISKEAVRRNFKILFLSGAAIGVNWILLFESYRYTTVSTATLSYYMAPVFVILASPLVVKEKLTAVKCLCALAAFAGMILISGVLTEPGEGVTFKGIGFGLGAAAFYASVMLLNQFLKDISAYDMTITQLGMASLVLLPYTLVMEDLTALNWTVETTVFLLIVGIVHTGMTYTLYFGSMHRLHAQTAALFSYIDPIVAIILSACWLGEPLGSAGLAGAVLILGSTVVSSRFA